MKKLTALIVMMIVIISAFAVNVTLKDCYGNKYLFDKDIQDNFVAYKYIGTKFSDVIENIENIFNVTYGQEVREYYDSLPNCVVAVEYSHRKTGATITALVMQEYSKKVIMVLVPKEVKSFY